MSITELVLKAKQCDNEAKSELCERTYNLAYFTAVKLVKEDDVLDILQDSYIKAFNNLDTLENPERFTSWLTSIVLNKSKDYLKKKKPTLFVEMQNDNFDSDFDIEDDKTDFQPEAQVDYSETKSIISDMIDSLPDDQRACVIMFYFEEMSVLEIASIMNLSENTIKSKLFYARKKIKAQVLDMERQHGVKLYSVAPIPFIIWVLRQQAANTMLPQEAAAQIIGAATSGSKVTVAAVEAATEIATESGATAATATNAGTVVNSAASKIASVVTTNIAKIGSVKLVAGIAAGVIAATGIGAVAYQSNKKPDEAAIQRAMTILINDPMFFENSAKSMWGDYSGTGDYQSKSGYEAFMDKYGESDFAEQVGRTLYPDEASAAQVQNTESSTASESSMVSEAENSKPEEESAPQEDTFTMSIYGHEVHFPSSYQDKIQIKEGIDSQGDSYASVYYKPLYDRTQQGENFDKFRNGEVMYTDLWTRDYYDNYIKTWYDRCVAQGNFSDPIPEQRAMSFKSDTILVSMHFAPTPSNTEQSDPDIAEFAKLLEIVKESCKRDQAQRLPYDEPNYNLYLKAWWEGSGIITYSGEMYTQNIFGHDIKLPIEWKGQLSFANSKTWINDLPDKSWAHGFWADPMAPICEDMHSRVDNGEIAITTAWYIPLYNKAKAGTLDARLMGESIDFEGEVAYFFMISRSEYNYLVKYWYDYCRNNNFKYYMSMVGGNPISINENDVLLYHPRLAYVPDIADDSDFLNHYNLEFKEIVPYFDNMFVQSIKNDQPNYNQYLKNDWEEGERQMAQILADLELYGHDN